MECLWQRDGGHSAPDAVAPRPGIVPHPSSPRLPHGQGRGEGARRAASLPPARGGRVLPRVAARTGRTAGAHPRDGGRALPVHVAALHLGFPPPRSASSPQRTHRCHFLPRRPRRRPCPQRRHGRVRPHARRNGGNGDRWERGKRGRGEGSPAHPPTHPPLLCFPPAAVPGPAALCCGLRRRAARGTPPSFAAQPFARWKPCPDRRTSFSPASPYAAARRSKSCS